MNAVLIAVIVMLVLSVARVHVVIALFLGALTGGLMAGMGLDSTLLAFQDGLGGGAKIAPWVLRRRACRKSWRRRSSTR